jgi:hypothetical protein
MAIIAAAEYNDFERGADHAIGDPDRWRAVVEDAVYTLDAIEQQLHLSRDVGIEHDLGLSL